MLRAEHWPSRTRYSSLRTLQSSEWVKVMCEWMAWVGSGLMMTLLRDVEREREETITLLSGMSARTGSGQSWAARSPSVLPGPVSQSTLLWISTATRGPGRSRELSSSSRARLPALVLTRPGRAGPGIASDTGPGRRGAGAPWRVRRVQDRRNGHVSVLLDKC